MNRNGDSYQLSFQDMYTYDKKHVFIANKLIIRGVTNTC